jgi:hypothetical protein
LFDRRRLTIDAGNLVGAEQVEEDGPGRRYSREMSRQPDVAVLVVDQATRAGPRRFERIFFDCAGHGIEPPGRLAIWSVHGAVRRRRRSP